MIYRLLYEPHRAAIGILLAQDERMGELLPGDFYPLEGGLHRYAAFGPGQIYLEIYQPGNGVRQHPAGLQGN
ncbi:MAG: hypothetical protein DRP95_00850 [Candidatus Latescibacterota bacterium]|nr:MAG: hypothetical protein DRP95_00850 [Candidatus Latescibacterota bacterium]